MTQSTMSPPKAPSDDQVLAQSIRVLACHPQSQRRYVQMGWMTPAVANLLRLTAELDGYIAAGKIAPEAADSVRRLYELVSKIRDRRPDLVNEENAGPREYLFSSALEDEDWEAIRQRAREAHHAVSGERSILIAIHAK